MTIMAIRLRDLAQRTGNETKALRTLVNGNLTDLSSMTTTTKASIVAAINEIVGRLENIQAEAGANINDASNASTVSTWSITKIAASIAAAAAATKAEILGGAGPAWDTLQELKVLLDNTDNDLSAFTTALANRVRVDTATQGLTTIEQANARTNIGAASAADIGDTDQDLVAIFEAALV